MSQGTRTFSDATFQPFAWSENHGRWLFGLSHDNGDVVSHNAAIAACGKAQWSMALYLWDICGARIQPNVRTYGAMASACRQWTMAIFLLQDMGQKAVPPNLVIFNTCARGSRSEGVWIQSMELLKATAVDHQPDVISFTLGVGACEQTACWQGAMDLLYQGMLSTRQLEPDMMVMWYSNECV